jgi:ABC-type transport system involved in multi-copper enzyme maturation permease subunit
MFSPAHGCISIRYDKGNPMILSIAVKEFYNNLVSVRFMIGLLLCLVLIPFTLVVSMKDYSTERQTYETARQEAERANQARVWSAYRPIIVHPPEPLSIFSRGIVSNVGNSVKVLVGEIPLFGSGRTAERDNPLLNAFSTIDFITILSIVMSLIALMFTYDACSNEREMGTFKLMFSYSVGRAKVLMGKLLGIMLTIIPIFVFCYLLAILLILLFPNIHFGADEWLRIVLLFLIGIVYCSFFIVTGLVVSTANRSSSTSGVICFSLWIFTVFAVPNLTVLSARVFVPTGSLEDVSEQMDALDREVPEKPNTLTFKGSATGSDGRMEITGITPELALECIEYFGETEPFRIDNAVKKWAYQKAYLDQLDRQRRTAELLSMVSPSELYQNIASGICRTDAGSYQRFMDSVRGYRNILMTWFADNGIFGSYEYFTRQDPDTFMSADAMVEYLTMGDYTSWQQWNDFAETGGSIFATIKRELDVKAYAEFEPLDLGEIPQYSQARDSTGDDVKRVLHMLATLVISGIILSYISFVSFVRYDVR